MLKNAYMSIEVPAYSYHENPSTSNINETPDDVMFNLNYLIGRCNRTVQKLSLEQSPGLKITAGHRTMSGQDDYLSGQNLGLAVILTGQVRSFQIIH